MTETTYTNRIKKKLEAEGAFVIKYRPGNGQRVGVPDMHIIHPLWVGWIEVKYNRNPLRPVQRSVIEAMSDAGGSVHVLRGPDHELLDLSGDVLARLDIDEPLIPQLQGTPTCST